MASSIGIRELRDTLSAVLRRVRAGESITVTDRRRPIAVVVPVEEAGGPELVRRLVAAGALAWAGGKPRGAARPPAVRGESVAAAVLEDRR